MSIPKLSVFGGDSLGEIELFRPLIVFGFLDSGCDLTGLLPCINSLGLDAGIGQPENHDELEDDYQDKELH
jgi:hypothetical protein